MLAHMVLPGDHSALRRHLSQLEFSDSLRTGGMISRSRIFGYKPRTSYKQAYCTLTRMEVDAPQTHRLLMNYSKFVDAEYKKLNPEIHARHLEQAQKVLPEYLMEGTVFTSGIVNDNNPLPYHHDAGNFTGAWSNMLVLKNDVGGGMLSVPELGIKIDFADGSLLMFDGQSLLHGVTPIVKTKPTGKRFSVVYYSLKGMWKCLPPQDEIIQARIRRTEMERRRAGIK